MSLFYNIVDDTDLDLNTQLYFEQYKLKEV